MASDSSIAEHLKWRKPKIHNHPKHSTPPSSDPTPQMPSIIQSTGCKSTISSLLLSTFTNNENTHNNNKNKTPRKSSSLRALGCASSQPQVTVPNVIRSSAVWEENDNKDKKKSKKKKNKNKKKVMMINQQQLQGVLMDEQIGVQDLWCADSSAADDSVDCVRPRSARGKIDLDKLHQRERASYTSRQRVNNEQFSGLDTDSAFDVPSFGPDVFEARHYNNLHNRSPEGLAEILMFQNGILSNRRSGADKYRDLRLDVDNMSYEELLELGDRIGHVSTGLGEDQIGRCLRKTKLSVLHELPPHPHMSSGIEGKCSICQEEYEAEDEVAKLECEHAYHLHCIEQWLVRKNACPVCKAEASSP